MKIYIVRHGETDWNVDKKCQGQTDIPLNQTGKEQAEKTRELLLNKNIDLIICSPLGRAKETANIINKDRNIDIIFDDRLKERKFGDFEGLHFSEFDYEEFWAYNDNTYPKAESTPEFFDRISGFLDEIKNKYKDKNVLLSTHGGVTIAVHCYFNGMPKDKDLRKVGLNNCEVAEYEIRERLKSGDER